MKIMQTMLFITLVGTVLAGCGASSQATATSFPESMKGYELYSWQDNGQWKFSLLVGTNREKTMEEIQSAGDVLSGVDELTSALERIPAGQYITWSSKETLSLPSQDILKQVEHACKDQGLILNIVS
jgi:hypothetical protein